ncbi:hypothetical protein PR048_032850 [Dryococelus australis]|uniref:Uncharacterized protein n=1 Tax=Dryococelus australis TaxID=614101 RepID=A0ABQ9G445_9NEOP|nr:hypothetical protein PR048_032850 [Dryococelus australis]
MGCDAPTAASTPHKQNTCNMTLSHYMSRENSSCNADLVRTQKIEQVLFSGEFCMKQTCKQHGYQRGCESEHLVYIVVRSPSRTLSWELGQQKGLSVTSRVSERILSRRTGTRPKSNSLPEDSARLHRFVHVSTPPSPPPIKPNWVQSSAGLPPDFRKWESCRTMPLVGGFFSGVSRFPLPYILALLHTQLTSSSSALKTGDNDAGRGIRPADGTRGRAGVPARKGGEEHVVFSVAEEGGGEMTPLRPAEEEGAGGDDPAPARPDPGRNQHEAGGEGTGYAAN